RNPPETGIMDRELKRIKNANYLLSPASDKTAGHGTTGSARWFKAQLAEFLQQAPRRGM
ncbi:MAG: alpha/beta hydrolase fold protein, partial [Frankiales bacterium]|nr:alpha/beta hydrolase fold protein [Frankiales bacterium]